ncbi:MAG TPA: hypothetical protein VJR48_02255 [Ktedonobacterales bacterium]|nr:hypothetical protein [Ktedonobacterales bacterium]
MRRRWLKIGIVVSAFVVVAACVRFLAIPLLISHPDSVHIVVSVVTEHRSQQSSTIFDQTFSQQATDVYSELVADSPITGTYSCPMIGENRPHYHYELTFTRWGITTATATSDAVGCMFFAVQYPLGATDGYSWYRGEGHPTFWVRLYELTNAPQPQ